VPAYHEWVLPAREFEGLWESLYYDTSVKPYLLKYAGSALLFSDMGVNNHIISWNRCPPARLPASLHAGLLRVK
jgi:pachytene checkpoint protein 2